MSYTTTTPTKTVGTANGTSKTISIQQKKPALLMRWMLALLMFITIGANAQVSNLLNPTYGYTFLNTTSTYTTLSGGTVFQSAGSLNTDGVSAAITLPFTFTYNGIKENTIFISNNGFITFALAPTATQYSPISSTTSTGYDGAISGFGVNCVASTASGAAPEIRYGTNGGGDFVVQYQDLGQSAAAGARVTFQIILKTTGVIQIVYGPNNIGFSGASQAQVGLRGTNDEDWNNRTLSSGGNWNTAGGAAGTVTQAMSYTATTTVPASGRTFQWSPTAYAPTYLPNAGGVVQEFTTWTNGAGPNNIPTTNFASNGYGNASWQIDNNPGTTTTTGWGSVSLYLYSPVDYVAAVGGHSARFHAGNANSPQVGYLDYYVDLSAIVGTPTLDFFHINTSGADILQVFLSTDGGTTFAQIGANIGVSLVWTAKTISLGGANSATTIIRFKATADFGSTDIGIDHMLVTPPPALPTITSFTPNTNLCANGAQTVTITGTNFTGTSAVTFNLVNAASFSVVNSTTITAVTPAALTAGVIDVTNPAGTATSAAYTVATNPIVTVSPITATICSPGGTPETLTAGGAVTYTWSPTAGLTPTSGSPVSAAPTATTTYTVTGTDANGCTGTATSAITVNASPAPVTFTPSAPTVCSGVTQMITSTGGPSVAGTSSTIGGGTGFTSPTGEQTAFCNRRLNYVGQTIYTAADLLAAGVVAGNITSLAYNISTDGDATSNANFTVKIGHVGSTTVFPSTAFFNNASYTPVFGPATYTHAAPGFQTITFTTPFVWDGSSNICIDVRHDGIDDINNAATQFTTTGNASLYGYNTPVSGTLSTSRLNIQLGYEVPATTLVWAPTTSLYTDPGASVAYTGTPSTNVVYFNGTSTETYTVTSTNAAGCTSTGNVTVTVTPLSCSAATFSATRCDGGNFTVTANTTGGGAPYSYDWDDGLGGIYPDAATITANLPAGTYNFTCLVTDACGSSCNSDVTVIVNPLPTVTVSPSTGLICNPGGSAVTLTAGGAATYAWSPTSGLTPTTGSPVDANPTATTTYTVTGTDANGCVSTNLATATITVGATVTMNSVTAASPTVCTNGGTTLTANASTPAATYCTASATSTSFEKISNVTLDAINNTSSATAGYENFTAVSTALVATTGYPVSISVSSAYASDDRVYIWIDMNQNGVFDDPSEKVFDEAVSTFCPACSGSTTAVLTGTVTVPGTALNGATRMRIRLQDNSSTPNTTPCGTSGFGQVEDYTVNISGGTDAFTYLWSPATFLSSTTTNPTTTSTMTLSQTYSVTATAASGCTASGNVNVTVADYTITATATTGGSISPNGATVLCPGDNQTYTITADPCYSIDDVLVDGVSQGAIGTYTFTNVQAAHTIAASFILNTFTITASAGAGGSISPSGAVSVNCGDNQSFTITADPCYSIDDVLVDGVSVGNGGSYTFTNVQAAHTIAASFVLNTFTITASAGTGGSISPSGAVSVNCGANQSFTITPDPGYVIDDVLVDGISVGNGGSYTFTNVQVAHTIAASFVLDAFNINATAGIGGTISPNGNTSVNSGGSQSYTITADPCYSIDDVLVDGVSIGAAASYTFTNVTANHTIVASFTQNGPYTITVTAGANGSITPGTSAVACGSNATYSITPNACYSIVDVIVDGVPQGPITTYTFTDVQVAHSISATFVINAPFPAPGPLSGFVNVCPYVGTPTQLTYSVPAIPGATSYAWVIPPTCTLVSQNMNSIVITIGAGFIANANKQIRVTALSACGNSPQSIFYLLAQLPNTPGTITASSVNVCAVLGSGTITYSIAPVVGATSYVWTAPNGATVQTGQGTTSVTVAFPINFTTGSITVRSVNDCGTSSARSISVVRNNPSTPSLISGPTNACPYLSPNGTPATYTVPAVATVTTYTWTVPPGAIGLTGQGTNSISFTYPPGFTSGTVSVTATNGCGTSGVRSLTIGTLNPATPSVIDVLQTAPCPNRVYSYTLAGMPANASSVLWVVPTGQGAVLLSGQGTSSISVSYPATAIDGVVTAQGVNNCGVSVTRSTTVKLAACPPEDPRPVGNNNTLSKGTAAPVVDAMSVNVYPNPTTTDFKLQVITAGKEEISVRVLDMAGRFLKQVTVMPYQTINIGAELKAGSYLIEVRQGSSVKTTRVLKF